MESPPLSPSRPPARRICRLALFLAATAALASGRPASAQLPLAGPEPPMSQLPVASPGTPATMPAATTPTTVLGLHECLQLALQRQPRIAAARASLAAAQDGSRALENLNAPTLLVPDLPIRRRQAALGVTAATAGLDQAERETVYAVTRTYFTVLYAREQERVARGIVDRLTATRDAAQKQLEGGARNIAEPDVQRASVYVRLAEAKRLQASHGVKRAEAALKEAIGLGPQGCFEVAPGRLPEVDVRPCLADVANAALSRRAELVRAGVFADVTCLEAEAQSTNIHRKMETFAAGSDIHAVVVPQGVQNSEFRPGALPPEMPTLLVGNRPDRVQRARDFHARALAVSEMARNLVTLEAEDAFFRWEEASVQIPEAKVAADTGDKLAEGLSKDFAAGAKVKVEEVVSAARAGGAGAGVVQRVSVSSDPGPGRPGADHRGRLLRPARRGRDAAGPREGRRGEVSVLFVLPLAVLVSGRSPEPPAADNPGPGQRRRLSLFPSFGFLFAFVLPNGTAVLRAGLSREARAGAAP